MDKKQLSLVTVNQITIKPITNEADFQETSALIDALVDADLLEDPDERKRALDLLETLTVLAIDYEKRHYDILRLDPIEAMRSEIEEFCFPAATDVLLR